jgi:multiple sugar transport system substrate-binding protein
MNKRLLRCLGVCILLSGVATSCSGGSTSNGGNGGDNITSDEYLGSTKYDCDVVLPSDDPSSQVEINFWHCLGHDKENNLNKIVETFNTKYAGKYKVTLTKLAGDYDSLHSAVKTKLAAGEKPSICMGYPDSFAEYLGDIDDSQIYRLNNLVSDPNVGFTDAEKSDFVSQYYLEGMNYQVGGLWSLPMYKSTEVMYYNENYFRGDNLPNQKKFKENSTYNTLRAAVTAGGSNPTEESLKALEDFCKTNGGYTYSVPTTWKDMVSLATLMKADCATEGVSEEFYPLGYDSDSNLMISQLAQNDIAYTDSSKSGSDMIEFNNADAKNLATTITDLIKDKLMITKGSLGGSKYTSNYFNVGSLAMSVGSTGGSSYQISSSFKVSLAPVPYSNNNAKYIMQGPSVCFFNNSNDYEAKGAFLFYKELSDPQANADLALENSYDPIRISSYDTTSYKNWLSHKGEGLSYDIPAITATLKNSYMTSDVFVGSSTARDEIGNVLAYVVNNNMTVDQAFDLAYKNTLKALAD